MSAALGHTASVANTFNTLLPNVFFAFSSSFPNTLSAACARTRFREILLFLNGFYLKVAPTGDFSFKYRMSAASSRTAPNGLQLPMYRLVKQKSECTKKLNYKHCTKSLKQVCETFPSSTRWYKRFSISDVQISEARVQMSEESTVSAAKSFLTNSAQIIEAKLFLLQTSCSFQQFNWYNTDTTINS